MTAPTTVLELRGNLAQMNRKQLLSVSRAWGFTAHRLNDTDLRKLLERLAIRTGRVSQ